MCFSGGHLLIKSTSELENLELSGILSYFSPLRHKTMQALSETEKTIFAKLDERKIYG